MDAPEELTAMLRERLAKNPGWWAARYEEALSRITIHDGPGEPYWLATDETCSMSDGSVMTFDGSVESGDEAEARAWELLVLADLARMNEPVNGHRAE